MAGAVALKNRASAPPGARRDDAEGLPKPPKGVTKSLSKNLSMPNIDSRSVHKAAKKVGKASQSVGQASRKASKDIERFGEQAERIGAILK